MSASNLSVTHHAILLANILVFTGLGFILYRMYRVRQCRDFGLLLDVMLLWALAVSPVLSPQYFTWVVPLTFLVLVGRFVERAPTPRGVFAIGFTILMAYLTKWIFPAHYDQLIGQQTLPMLMLNLRNVSLMILTYFLLTDAGLVKAVHHYVPTRMFAGIRRTFAADTALMIVALFILIGIRPMLVTSFREIGFVAQEKYESFERLPLARDVDAESIVVVSNIVSMISMAVVRIVFFVYCVFVCMLHTFIIAQRDYQRILLKTGRYFKYIKNMVLEIAAKKHHTEAKVTM
jgi:hypothetical protein